MKIVILGCGRVGSQLANSLSVEGHDISIIDKDPKAFRRLSRTFSGNAIAGIGFDRDVMESAGIKEADGFASVTNGDNSNIISALIAKREYHVPRVITRIYDPMRANIYKKFGIPTISSTVWGANELREHLLYAELKSELVFGSGEVQLIELEVPQGLVGHAIRELEVPGQILVVCIVRLGRALVPDSAMVFEQGDLVHANVASESLARYKQLTGYQGG